MELTLDEARKITEAGIAKAEQMKIKVTVTVLDAAGHIVSMNRMDGAPFLSPEISLGKAYASAAFRKPSAELQKGAETRTSFFSGISTLTQGRFLAGMGALPVMKGQQCVGAVGVSGARPEEDQEVAQAGLAAL